jgi:protein-S-isoprenylcysteine O-methyltransferase Ste14
MVLIEQINAVIVILVSFAILVAILINFFESENSSKTKKEKKSIVETGTMLLFFLAFYAVIKFNIGHIGYNYPPVHILLIIIGWIILLASAYVNIAGRFKLGHNWANQIKIYDKHKLVSSGVYRIVRHPLYASLIWMFYAGAIIYSNWLAILLNSIVFIPAMYYRARQEETLLIKEFAEYNTYKRKVGMFFPKVLCKK